MTSQGMRNALSRKSTHGHFEWLPQVLAVQLVLVFFTPPIGVGDRRLYLADLWCWLWVAVFYFFEIKNALRGKPLSRQSQWLLKFAILAMGVLSIIYLRGYFRDNVFWAIRKIGIHYNEPDDFKPIRELVVGLRFLSWTLASALSFSWFKNRNGLQDGTKGISFLLKTLVICVFAASLAMIADQCHIEIRKTLGRLYNFNPAYEAWANRAYGVFPAPVEAGLCFALSGLLLLSQAQLPKSWTLLGVISATSGILLAKTITPVLALIGVGTVVGILNLRKQKKLFIAVVCGAIVLLGFVFVVSDIELSRKLGNFTFRFDPWRVYFDALCWRWTHLLFGFGFVPYHADNFFVFLLTRGGLFLLVVCLGFGAYLLGKHWRHWNWLQRSIPLFLLVSSITFDVFILRHIATLMIVIGMPTLALLKK